MFKTLNLMARPPRPVVNSSDTPNYIPTLLAVGVMFFIIKKLWAS